MGVVVVMQGASIAWAWVPGRRRRSTASGLCSTLSMMDTYPTGTALFEQRKDMPLPQPRRTPAAPQCDKRKASLTGRYPQWLIGPAPSRLNHEIISPWGGEASVVVGQSRAQFEAIVAVSMWGRGTRYALAGLGTQSR